MWGQDYYIFVHRGNDHVFTFNPKIYFTIKIGASLLMKNEVNFRI